MFEYYTGVGVWVTNSPNPFSDHGVQYACSTSDSDKRISRKARCIEYHRINVYCPKDGPKSHIVALNTGIKATKHKLVVHFRITFYQILLSLEHFKSKSFRLT